MLEWESASQHMSSVRDKAALPEFREIVRLGNKAVPFIIRRLRDRPSFLFLALAQITEENPVPHGVQGNVPAIIDSWMRWAEREGIDAN
jgi:hypothetical protein